MLTRIPGLMFEAVAEPVVDAGGGDPVVDDTPAPDPVDTPAAEDTTPVEPAAPDYSAMLSSPEAQAAIDRATEARLAAMFPQDNTPAEDPLEAAIAELDPLADDFGPQLAKILADHKQSVISEVSQSPASQAAEQEWARKWADDQFGTIEKGLGPEVTLDPELRELSIFAAHGMNADPSQAPQVLAHVATRLHSHVTQREQAAVDAYKQSLLEGDGTVEPGPGGTAGVRAEAPAGSYDEIVNKYYG